MCSSDLSYGLSDQEIMQRLQDAFAYADIDMQQRALEEARIEAERLIIATQSALEQDADLLSAEELAHINALLNATRHTLTGNERDAIASAVKALSSSTEEFAARRMNRSVHNVLTGKKVNELDSL